MAELLGDPGAGAAWGMAWGAPGGYADVGIPLRYEIVRSNISVDQISPVQIMRDTVRLRAQQRWNRKRRHRG